MPNNNIISSFRNAFRGLFSIVKDERNLKIHLITFFVVVCFGFYFSITRFEWICILIVSGLVISLEIINSSLEKLCDFVEPNTNEKIKIIKDTAAAAVLVAAAFALIIGTYIFLPYLIG
jgi:undecaprenol kinase|tara:strand:+ start:6079 stop:6435 length:357 start_codon:yes stop_codon:yes gene_type:complete